MMSDLCSKSSEVTVKKIEMKNADFVVGRWIEFKVIEKRKFQSSIGVEFGFIVNLMLTISPLEGRHSFFNAF